jgi:hypothetical protein
MNHLSGRCSNKFLLYRFVSNFGMLRRYFCRLQYGFPYHHSQQCVAMFLLYAVERKSERNVDRTEVNTSRLNEQWMRSGSFVCKNLRSV